MLMLSPMSDGRNIRDMISAFSPDSHGNCEQAEERLVTDQCQQHGKWRSVGATENDMCVACSVQDRAIEGG